MKKQKAAKKLKGVSVWHYEKDTAVLHGLKPGTPVAIQVDDGRWWPYLSEPKGIFKPIGDRSAPTNSEALDIARRAAIR